MYFLNNGNNTINSTSIVNATVLNNVTVVNTTKITFKYADSSRAYFMVYSEQSLSSPF